MKLTKPGKAKQERRNQQIYRLYTQGEGLASIARDYGLTRERIRQVVEAKDKGA